jgi:hypothetical protein
MGFQNKMCVLTENWRAAMTLSMWWPAKMISALFYISRSKYYYTRHFSVEDFLIVRLLDAAQRTFLLDQDLTVFL